MKNKKSFLFSCLALLSLVFAMSCSNPSAPEVKNEKEKNPFMPTQEQAEILKKYAGKWYITYNPADPADLILDMNDKTIFMRDVHRDNGYDPRVDLGDITCFIVDVDVEKNNIIAKTKSINGKEYFIITNDKSYPGEGEKVLITINVKEDSLDGKKFTDWICLERE